MNSGRIAVSILGMAAIAALIYAETQSVKPRHVATAKDSSRTPGRAASDEAVGKSLKWLVSVQGHDGGWGQDGGETSYVRKGEHLESSGNDVANTAVALTALLRDGHGPTAGAYRTPFQRGLGFILTQVEQSPTDGLAITKVTGTQIQRKLGPYIDTFLTSKLLGELDGHMGDAQANARVRKALEKCIAKIEKNQLQDGSWNVSGGWAPILGTSLASQSLRIAKDKGVAVQQTAMARVDDYTKRTASGRGGGVRSGSGGVVGGVPGGMPSAGLASEAVTVSAGVPLYKSAQELEQLSRTPEDRARNAKQISAITSNLADSKFVSGFGSIGGEEFFSYLNISDSLRRTGGRDWEKWNSEMTAKLLTLQNEDGTWAGHHCITGRVAVTSAAILLLRADRDPSILTSSIKK